MTYTNTAKAVRSGLPAAAALLLALATPAQATSQEADRGNWLFVTVTTGDGGPSHTRGTLLLCDPPQGHGRAAEACEQLRSADGDLRALPVKDTYCPMVHAPVTTHASGEWNGRPVEYLETFSNGCVMGARTGVIFALDG
jgi:hypothetical protein